MHTKFGNALLIIIIALCLMPLNADNFGMKIPLKYDLGLDRPGFQVEIHSNNEGRVCDGSVISASAVLTAARCFYDMKINEFRNPKDIYVTFDAVNKQNSSIDLLSIDAISFVYPGSFDIATMKDDVAILLLDENIPNDIIHITNSISMQTTEQSNNTLEISNSFDESKKDSKEDHDSPLIGVLCFLAFTIYAAMAPAGNK